MADPTIHKYPEPGTLCSRITLQVHIDYGAEPFEAPGEWLYANILAYALNHDHEISVDANCVSHIPWVKLSQITYDVDTTRHCSTPEDETNYRIHCEGRGAQPSQDGFWHYILQRKLNIRRVA